MRRETLPPVDPFGPWIDSYNRMETVLQNANRMSRGDWFGQLGEAWTSCDNIGKWRVLLRAVLLRATRDELDRMMTTEEHAALTRLPDRIEVWRGCYAINRSGLSWTTDHDLAARFPRFNRYRRFGDQPLLRRGVALRERAVLKLCRNEQEIIAARVSSITETLLGER